MSNKAKVNENFYTHFIIQEKGILKIFKTEAFLLGNFGNAAK